MDVEWDLIHSILFSVSPSRLVVCKTWFYLFILSQAQAFFHPFSIFSKLKDFFPRLKHPGNPFASEIK